MSSVVTVEGFGVLAEVETEDSAVRTVLRRRLPKAVEVRAGTSGEIGTRRWRAANADDVADRVLPELELWIAEWAADRVFVHAGSVAVNGQALVLPGRSHAGKSTLTASLLQAGATYLSDEYAVLDADGFVHPYSRPLRLRTPDGGRAIETDRIGAVAVDPVPVGLIAHLRYDPGQGADIRHATRATGAMALLDNAVCAQTRPEESLAATTQAASGADVVVGTRGEADDTAARLLDLMGDDGRGASSRS